MTRARGRASDRGALADRDSSGTKKGRRLVSDGSFQKYCRPQGLGLGVTGELALGAGTGKTHATLRPATGDTGATALGGHTSEETELADTTLLGGLERSFHGKYLF